ncbi:MAG: hypothetical protein K2K58_04255 [Muribaculaceae bacterium]|nr:hypothetical protein [Muribaculaceae bacterium]
MHSIESNIRKLRFCLVIALVILLAGCASDDELSQSGKLPDNEGITLEFTMLTRNAESAGLTRSDITSTRSTEVGHSAENYLNLDNLTFLLFDDGRKMLRSFIPEISVADETTGPYVKYRVRTFLHDKYFLRATSEHITFSIVVLGNYSGHSPEDFNFHIGQSLEELFDQTKVGTFAMPVPNNSLNTWIPTIAPLAGQGAGHIPMAGLQTFTVAVADLRNSTPDNPYQLSGGSSPKYINMLRALAKIEIVDKITSANSDDDYFSVDKIELVGHTTRGSILPSFSQWATGPETQYVISPSIPSSAVYKGADPIAGLNVSTSDDTAVTNFFEDTDATNARGDGGRVFSCYLTEYDPTLIGTDPGIWIRLTMKSQKSGRYLIVRLEAAPYKDGKPGEAMPILRNNIYRYIITGAKDISLDIQPFANMELAFGFGLRRDARGDLMVLPDKDGNYPDYFIDFANTHGYPHEEDETGNQTENLVRLEEGDYYAIVAGQNGEMSDASIWVKDRDSCRVLSNFGSSDHGQDCSARLVESFYGNNESERFLKDKFGYRRVHHFNNHNSIVRHPTLDNMLFCYIENYNQEGQTRKYYEVESWDEPSETGWIINKDSDGTETGFQKIRSDGTLGETIPLN